MQVANPVEGVRSHVTRFVEFVRVRTARAGGVGGGGGVTTGGGVGAGAGVEVVGDVGDGSSSPQAVVNKRRPIRASIGRFMFVSKVDCGLRNTGRRRLDPGWPGISRSPRTNAEKRRIGSGSSSIDYLEFGKQQFQCRVAGPARIRFERISPTYPASRRLGVDIGVW
jgi:hypothetical protein